MNQRESNFVLDTIDYSRIKGGGPRIINFIKVTFNLNQNEVVQPCFCKPLTFEKTYSDTVIDFVVPSIWYLINNTSRMISHLCFFEKKPLYSPIEQKLSRIQKYYNKNVQRIHTQKNTEYITPSFVIEFWKMINCTTCFAYKPNFLRKYIIYKQILKFVIELYGV